MEGVIEAGKILASIVISFILIEFVFYLIDWGNGDDEETTGTTRRGTRKETKKPD